MGPGLGRSADLVLLPAQLLVVLDHSEIPTGPVVLQALVGPTQVDLVPALDVAVRRDRSAGDRLVITLTTHVVRQPNLFARDVRLAAVHRQAGEGQYVA